MSRQIDSDYRIQVGNKSGKLIGELDVPVTNYFEGLNKLTTAELRIPTNNPALNSELIRDGNRVLIDWSNGLPSFGGIMIFPFTYSSDRTVTVPLRGPLEILGQRTTDRGRYFDNAPVSYILKSVLNEANRITPTYITPGNLELGGTLHSPSYHFQNLRWILETSICSNLSDWEFWFTVQRGRGRSGIGFSLSHQVHLARKRGSDLSTKVWLIEGHNATDISVGHIGPIYNSINAAGDGTGWGDDRLLAFGNDEQSISKYGLREYFQTFSGVVNPSTLQAHVDSLLSEFSEQRIALEISAIDAEPARFSSYNVGDTVQLMIHNLIPSGLFSKARILGRDFSPETQKARLIVELQ